MKRLKSILFLIFLVGPFSIYADTFKQSYHFKSYEQASHALYFIKFEMKSTKAGILTTHFDGYLKKFSLQTHLKNNHFTKAKVQFAPNDLDTNNDGRNEKMHQKIFQIAKFPQLSVLLEGPLPLGKTVTARAKIIVLNSSHNIEVKLTSSEIEKLYIIEGEATLSLSGLGLPDPSIFIASVDDQIKVRFKVAITK